MFVQFKTIKGISAIKLAKNCSDM